jgi:hypothetical protein
MVYVFILAMILNGSAQVTNSKDVFEFETLAACEAAAPAEIARVQSLLDHYKAEGRFDAESEIVQLKCIGIPKAE